MVWTKYLDVRLTRARYFDKNQFIDVGEPWYYHSHVRKYR